MPIIDYQFEDEDWRELECEIEFSYSAGTPDSQHGPGDHEELEVEKVRVKCGVYIQNDMFGITDCTSTLEVKEPFDLEDLYTLTPEQTQHIKDHCMEWIQEDN